MTIFRYLRSNSKVAPQQVTIKSPPTHAECMQALLALHSTYRVGNTRIALPVILGMESQVSTELNKFIEQDFSDYLDQIQKLVHGFSAALGVLNLSHGETINMVESVILFALQVSDVSSLAGFAVACATLWKSLYRNSDEFDTFGGSLTYAISRLAVKATTKDYFWNRVSELWDTIKAQCLGDNRSPRSPCAEDDERYAGHTVVDNPCYDVMGQYHLTGQHTAWLFEEQSFGEHIDDLRRKIDYTKAIGNSPLLKALHKVLVYCLARSSFECIGVTFDNLGYSEFEATELTKQHSSNAGFFVCTFDTLVSFLQKFFQCRDSGSLDPLLFTGEGYAKWSDEVARLTRLSKFGSNLEPHGTDIYTFSADLDAAILKGRDIKRYTTVNTLEKRYLGGLLSSLEMLKSNLTAITAVKEARDAPFTYLICGDSSIAKSHLMDICNMHLQKAFGLPTGDQYTYTKLFTSDFYDGLQSCCHTLILDDVASLHPSKASSDPSTNDIISICNNVVCIPNMAALEDKGRVRLAPEIVVATTNTKHLNAQYYYKSEMAIRRRFPIILNVRLKNAVRTNGMFDPVKAAAFQAVGEYDNYWNVSVEKVTAGENQTVRLVPLKKFTEINELVAYLARSMRAHKDSQLMKRTARDHMQDITVCTACYEVSTHCTCHEEQSADLPIESSVGEDASFIYSATTDCGYNCVQSFFDWLINYIIRWYMRRLGQKTAKKFAKFRSAIFIFSTLSITLAAVYLARRMTTSSVRKEDEEPEYMEEQFALDLHGVTPRPRAVERDNAWRNDNITMQRFQPPELSRSWKSLSPEAIKGKIYGAIRRANFVVDSTGKATTAMIVSTNLIVVNTHAVPKVPQFKLSLSMEGKQGITNTVTGLVCASQCYTLPHRDITFIHIPFMAPGTKVIYSLLQAKPAECKLDGEYLLLRPNYQREQLEIRQIRYDRLDERINGSIYDIRAPRGRCVGTVKGDCGAPMLAMSTLGPVILGIHSLANQTGDVWAMPLYQCDVDEALKELNAFDVQSGVPRLVAHGRTMTLGALHPKSPFRYFENGTAHVYGSFSQGFRHSPKSFVARTVLADAAERHGYVQKYDKPVMSGWEPIYNNLKPLVAIPNTIRQDILEAAAEAYFQDVKHMAAQLDLPYSLEVAVNGVPGVTYVDGINRQTSAGFPTGGPKSRFLRASPTEEQPHRVVVDDETLSRVSEIIDTYLRGERVMPVFSGHLKDTPTKFKAIASKKTRLFGGCEFAWALVVRKFFLPLIRVIQNNQTAFEAAPGITAQSPEWGGLFEYITQYGVERIMAGDWGHYDKNMQGNVIMACFKVFIQLATLAGYSQDDIKIMMGIAFDTAFPVFDINGDFVMFGGSNPSGHPLTVIINCVAHSIYMRYFYAIASGNPLKWLPKFRQMVAFMSYGDDGIASVNEECTFFNHTVMQDLVTAHGMVYTMADKEAASVPFVHIKDATFLKRSWVFNDDVGHYLAPLERESIERSIMTTVCRFDESRREQAISIVGSAVREYFLHGREVFEREVAVLKSIVQESGIEDYVQEHTFPSWDTLKASFLSYGALRSKAEIV